MSLAGIIIIGDGKVESPTAKGGGDAGGDEDDGAGYAGGGAGGAAHGGPLGALQLGAGCSRADRRENVVSTGSRTRQSRRGG